MPMHWPDVDECGLLCHRHSTVSPTWIVVVLVPLTESTNCVLPLGPTKTT